MVDTVHKIFNILNSDNTQEYILENYRFDLPILYADITRFESYSIWYIIPFNKNYQQFVGLLMGHAVAQLVQALRYKLEGRGFDSRWCHWNFSLT